LFGIQGMSGAQPQQPVQQTNYSDKLAQVVKSDVQEAKSLMQDIVRSEQNIDIESSLVTNKEAGKTKQETPATATRIQAEAKPHFGEEALAQMASVLADEQVDRKKRKKRKTKFEEKLEELQKLKGTFDLAGLSPQDKQIVEEFLNNLDRIKQQKGQLEQLEKREDYYLEILQNQDQEGEPENK
jgi:hypothetical protein